VCPASTSVERRANFRQVARGPSYTQMAVFVPGACVLKYDEEDVYPTLPSVKRRIDFRLVLRLPVFFILQYTEVDTIIWRLLLEWSYLSVQMLLLCTNVSQYISNPKLSQNRPYSSIWFSFTLPGDPHTQPPLNSSPTPQSFIF
jgi:hypothetical protein